MAKGNANSAIILSAEHRPGLLYSYTDLLRCSGGNACLPCRRDVQFRKLISTSQSPGSTAHQAPANDYLCLVVCSATTISCTESGSVRQGLKNKPKYYSSWLLWEKNIALTEITVHVNSDSWGAGQPAELHSMLFYHGLSLLIMICINYSWEGKIYLHCWIFPYGVPGFYSTCCWACCCN